MARRLPHRFSLLTFGVAGNPNENISREACCGFAATIHRGYQNAGSGRFVSGTRGSPVSRRNVIRREPLKFWRSSVNTEPALDPAFLRLRACALTPTTALPCGAHLDKTVT